jgi:glycosyltransferase involved in cell wall biosynthesis
MPDSYIAPLYHFFLGRVNASADCVVFVSEVSMTEVPHDNARALVIHDALPDAERWPADYGADHPGFQFLYLANFTPGKGHEFAIQAFAAMKRPAECFLTFVGGDLGLSRNRLYRKRLTLLAQSLNISGSVTFLDFVEDVEALIKASDVLLNFSESESFSMTCLEAMKYGTPVIASDSGGPGELLAHGRGVLVENRNVEQMTKAMEHLVIDPAYRQSLAIEARKFVTDRFKVADAADSIARLYRPARLQTAFPQV